MTTKWDGSALALFSTGIAFHKRVIQLKAGETKNISLPVKQEHLDNLLRSLRVKGDGVRWTKPANFEAVDSTANALELNAGDVTGSLAVGLSGAKISIDKANGNRVTGVLLGLDERPYGKDGALRRYLTVRTRQGITSVALDEVTDYRFPDKAIRAQIERALSRNRRKVQPGETTCDFTLTAEKDTNATIYFTQPSAAWKLSYRLAEQTDGRFKLEAFGIADNNTAEDWKQDVFSLVKGNPIHFETNIAQVFLPKRDFVNAISSKAAGRVNTGNVADYAAEAGYESFAPKGGRAARAAKAAPMMAGFAPAALMADSNEESAFQARTTASEVGDLQVFTAGDVEISNGKSGLIPLFSDEIEGKSVLFCDPQKHDFPWRAVKFKAPRDLGKGACTVILASDLGDMFGGEELLENCSAGDERLAVHQQETGVRVTTKNGDLETRRISIEISNGVIESNVRNSIATTYVVANKTGSAFSLVLDHARRIPGSTVSVDGGAEAVDLREGGSRVSVTLAPNATLALNVTERKLDGERFEVGNNPAWITQWLRTNVLSVENPLSKNKKLEKCFEVQGSIDETNQKLRDETGRVEELQAEQEELRSNLQAAGENAPNRGQWLSELETNRQEIKKSQKETQPGLRKELERLQKALIAALKDLSASWKDE